MMLEVFVWFTVVFFLAIPIFGPHSTPCLTTIVKQEYRLSQMRHDQSTKCQIPSLIDATSDELLSGLEKGCFTSVDLVNVSRLRNTSGQLDFM